MLAKRRSEDMDLRTRSLSFQLRSLSPHNFAQEGQDRRDLKKYGPRYKTTATDHSTDQSVRNQVCESSTSV